MKINRIRVYDRAIKRLKHGFVINAHRKVSPRSLNDLTRCPGTSFYRTLAEFTGAFIAKPCFNLELKLFCQLNLAYVLLISTIPFANYSVNHLLT